MMMLESHAPFWNCVSVFALTACWNEFCHNCKFATWGTENKNFGFSFCTFNEWPQVSAVLRSFMGCQPCCLFLWFCLSLSRCGKCFDLTFSSADFRLWICVSKTARNFHWDSQCCCLWLLDWRAHESLETKKEAKSNEHKSTTPQQHWAWILLQSNCDQAMMMMDQKDMAHAKRLFGFSEKSGTWWLLQLAFLMWTAMRAACADNCWQLLTLSSNG